MGSTFFNLQEFYDLAANYRSTIVRLSGDSLTLLLCTEPLTQPTGRWEGVAGYPNPSEADAIDAIVGQCYTELMISVAIGTIFPFATSVPPDGALECDGTTYLRVDYPDLYASLDSAFITDSDHFVVPDLRGRTLIGAGNSPPLSSYSVGDTGGTEDVTLTSGQMPAHNHGVTDAGHTHTEGIAIPNVTTIGPGAPEPTAVPSVGVTGLGFTGISIQSAGGGGAHENRQPYLALRYAIWTI